MAAFRIKLCGLNNIDASSLKSMLSLAGDQLTHDWEIVSSAQAELYIYSFDSDEGTEAWQQHNDQALSALLSTDGSSSEPVDIVLKKPLRTKNFSIALNDIEEQMKQGSKPRKKGKNSPSFISSLLSKLSTVFTKKSPFAKTALNFSLPEQDADNTNTLVDPSSLKKWLKKLENKEAHIQISDILGNLTPLNRTDVPTQTRLELLELYEHPIARLLHSQLAKGTKTSSASHSTYTKTVHAYSSLLEELSLGYQTVVNDFFQQAKRPNTNKQYCYAINRTAEYLSLSIVFAYNHYHAIPNNALNSLHQLYLYNEFHATLTTVPTLNKVSASHSFSHIYLRVLLLGIANPSQLDRHEVVDLYNLVAALTDKISLRPLANEDIASSSAPVVAGHFCVDTSSNRMPVPVAETAVEIRSLPQSRLLDTHQLLVEIEQVFQQETTAVNQDISVADIQLLKKVIPQFNTTYSRRYKRKACEDAPKLNIEIGLSAIHVSLINGSPSQEAKWTIHNRGSGGMMISSQDYDAYHLNIGDSIGIFEHKSQPKLAVIRWMVTSKEGLTHIGLEIKKTQIKAVSLTPKNKAEIFLGLLLPGSNDAKQEATILVSKGTYLPLQELTVSEGSKSYKISVNTLINNSFNDEQFSFKIKQ